MAGRRRFGWRNKFFDGLGFCRQDAGGTLLLSLVAVGFAAVVFFYKFIAFAQGALYFANEFLATLSEAAHGDDGVAFGVIVGDGEGLAVWF